MTEEYGGGESTAQERARKHLQELEEQRRGKSPDVEAHEGGEASEKASEYAEQGQEKAAEVAEQGREQAKGQIATQKERASWELQGIAQALQSAGDQFREQDQEPIGRYVGQAADQVGRFSEYLDDKDSEELIREVEDFARHRPAIFLGGAFLLGATAARFLKSSAGETGDLKEELKQAGEEFRQSAAPSGGGSSSGGSSHEAAGDPS